MNFSDFGIKDESELEQDKFSLSKPTFGKDNQLTVIGWKGKESSGNKVLFLKCSECSKDQEMFGKDHFTTTASRLRKGSIPCNCSSHYMNMDAHQYSVKITRECKIRNLVFHGFIGDFLGVKTRVKLECPKHGIWETSNIDKFTAGRGCPKCRSDNLAKRSRKPDELLISNFMATGKFKEGTKFWRSSKLNTQGTKAYWFSSCPICSNDEYVQAGLCSGVFETPIADLSRGVVPCRCSPSYYWTKEQYEHRIKKRMQESKTTDEFIGFIDGFKNAKSKFTRFCKTHGNYETTVHGYLDRNSECPQCANQTQQQGYINLVKQNEKIVALKFGIAKDSKQRSNTQHFKTKLDIEQLAVWEFPTVKACKYSESYVKKHLPCSLLTKQEMPDGYTETTSVENLEAIIKIYEDFGGVRKVTENNKNKEAA
jgi:predicted nucleic-acid-binding Zn-ribbon protein